MVPSGISKYVIIKVLLAIVGSWPIGTLTYIEISRPDRPSGACRSPTMMNMSETNGGELDQLSFAQRLGASLNEWGGYYCRDKHYGMEKKLAVAEISQL